MALTVAGLSANLGPSVVDAKDVQFYEITERASDTQHFVHLDGLVFHSSLAVAGIDIGYEDEAAIVQVRLTPAGKGLSGSFAVDVPLHPNTNRILFGPSRQQIWPNAPR
jgi:hypothetical protein